jgi:UPF0042 nucleotide-binding protein
MLKLTSFGFKYGVPEGMGIVINLNDYHFYNPWNRPDLRHLRGDDLEIACYIESSPLFADEYRILKARVMAISGNVFIGCTGGKHRSVYIVNRLGAELGVPIFHRDYNKA